MTTGSRPRRILLTGALGLALCAWSLPAMAGQQSGQYPGQSQQGQSQQNQAQPGQQGQQGQQGQAAGQPSGSAATQDPNQRAANLINTINNGEIDLGKMMQDQAQNSNVKDFSKTLTNDHQKAQDQLKDVASKSNLTLGTNAHEQAENQRLKDRLTSAQGTQRDREYLRAEVRGHAKAVRQLRHMETQVTDPQLKSYISGVIPTLQMHERDARHLLQQMGGGAGAGAPAGQAQPQGTPQGTEEQQEHETHPSGQPPSGQSAPSGQQQTPPSSQNPPMR